MAVNFAQQPEQRNHSTQKPVFVMIKKFIARLTLAGVFAIYLLLPPEALALFGVDIRTTANRSSDTPADRLFMNQPAVKAPAGTRIWIVLDVNGNGVPQNPLPGAILGADDQILVEDAVPGQLLPSFTGRYLRNGVLIADDSLRDKTNVFVYLWDFYETTNAVPHYEPPAGARYGTGKLFTTPVPDVGNAKWRIYTDVFANSFTVGGGGNQPPVITTQPTNASVRVGSSVTFTVVATGTPPLTYQWRKDVTNIIAGATTSTLTLTNVTAADAGSYDVRVANAVTNVLSAAAVLTVNPPVAQPTLSGVSAQTSGSDLVVSFTIQTETGASYQLQAAPNLSDSPIQWADEGSPVPGDGSIIITLSSTNNITITPMKFFRVVAE